MKWIGLTGGIASGKSTVTRILRELSVPVVDADEIARFVVENGQPGLQEIVQHFGPEILNPDGSLNRKKMGQIVFGKPERLLQLENILHPLIRTETLRRRQKLADEGHRFAFYDVPLLFEKNMESLFDHIVVVTADEATQRERMKARDGLSNEEIESRLQSQLPLSDKAKKASWVLPNNGTLEDLKKATWDMLQAVQSGSA